MRRYKSPSLLGPKGSEVRLTEADSHHLLRVNLTPRGTELLVFDEKGQEARATLKDTERGIAILEITEDPSIHAPQQDLVLIQGIPKRPALEHILRMATELGVTEIRIFQAQHSIAKGANLERWIRIVEGAISQCGRTQAPSINFYTSLEGALAHLPKGARLICTPGAQTPTERPQASVLLIGPEGGLSAKEHEFATKEEFQSIGLGTLTLRCDTAVAAALGLITPV